MAITGGQVGFTGYQQPDYSGVVAASSLPLAALSKSISDFGDEKKKINQDIAKGKSALQFAKANYPELAGRIDEIGKIFSDVNVSKADQAAAGSQMGEFVTAMIRGQEFNTEVDLKKRALGIQEAEALKDTALKNREFESKLNQRTAGSVYFGGNDIAVTEDGFGNIYDPDTDRLILNTANYAAGGENYGPQSTQLNQETGDLLQKSLELNDPSIASGGANNDLFPDGVTPQGNPMPAGTPTTIVPPEVNGPPTPRGVSRRTAGSENKTYTLTSDQVNETISQGGFIKVVGRDDDGNYIVESETLKLSRDGQTIEFTDPDGKIVRITSGGRVGGKEERVVKAQQEIKKESFRLNQANTEEAFARLDTAGTNNPIFAAGKALMAEVLPASETGELAGFYKRINDENSFIKMNQQRASSPTGGGAGQMTEKEWPKYQGRFSPLEINARKDTIVKSLSLNILNAFEAVNGMPDEVIKLLDEKKIDQATYNNYVIDYVKNRQIARVNANGVDGISYDWTKLNKKLLNKSTIFEAPARLGEILPNEQELIDKHKTK